MKTSVCKIFSFEAAHYLPGYKGKCSNLHGHHWTLEVKVAGFVSPKTGMVIDFVNLKNLVNEKVISRLDHTCLNEVLEGQVDNPTCENLLDWIWVRLYPIGSLSREVELVRLRLWETPNSYAELIK